MSDARLNTGNSGKESRVFGQVHVMCNHNILEGCSILLVEDDARQAIDLFETLAGEGARTVILVGELDEALRMAGSHRFDAAILDYRLGGNRAKPLAEYLDRIGTPFIVHTCHANKVALPGHWRGCRLIPKPSAPEKLVRTLAALLRWQRLSRSGTGEQLHVA
jgi:DNA-binding NtrC family response regulator